MNNGRTRRVGLLVGCLAVFSASHAAGQASIVIEDAQMVLGPTPEGGAIVVDTTLRLVFTPSPRLQTPQQGAWILDWDGSSNLSAGHYEGHWTGTASVQSFTFDEEGVPHLVVPARMTFVMPGYGTVTAHAVNYQTGLCGFTASFVQEWHYARLIGTGVFEALSDLSGEAVAVVERTCSPTQ
jgi:hypothetical protein